ncbi:hypothetical protein [Paenibacillus lemnae]|uniref:Uncharacterized protein n=1 Tax=Paenibacillus lemnae TaxID=1330551 RepID=A0A848MAU7_PAELE|nr:hypothetical protein [Paenibacillus lemnae]NMO97192.1 hypothetical protein [Paenibacillus lemnae]
MDQVQEDKSRASHDPESGDRVSHVLESGDHWSGDRASHDPGSVDHWSGDRVSHDLGSDAQWSDGHASHDLGSDDHLSGVRWKLGPRSDDQAGFLRLHFAKAKVRLGTIHVLEADRWTLRRLHVLTFL